MSHHDEATLVAFHDGELAPTEAEVVRRHLERCSECRARLDEVRRLKTEALDLIGALELPEPAGAASAPVSISLEMPVFRVAAPAASMAAAPVPLGSSPKTMAAVPTARRPRRWITGLAWAATIAMAIGIGYSAASFRRPAAMVPLQQPPVPAAASTDRAAPASPTPAPALSTPAEPAKARASGRRASVPPAPAPATPAPAAPPADERAKVLAETKTAQPARDEREAARNEDLDKDKLAKEKKDGVVQETAASNRLLARSRAPKPSALDQLVVTGGVAGVRPRVVPADSAIRTLGGSIKLIDGLVADHYEAQGPLVRVVYRVAWGSLVLEQRRMDTGLQFQLIAPTGAPADSIEAWRNRIK
jgi:hypothetical protein